MDFYFDGADKSSQGINDQQIDWTNDFSIQFWFNSLSDRPSVIISKKEFPDKSIKSQEKPGWAIYTSGGTFAWTIGSGERRLNYERDNGEIFPLNDGEWHLITMTYEKEISEFRLYYDGQNKAIYKVEFDFESESPLIAGFKPGNLDFKNFILPQIREGAEKVQSMVNTFNDLGIGDLKNEEFLDLIVDPSALIENRGIEIKRGQSEDPFKERLDQLNKIRREMLGNEFTVYQIMELTLLKPVSKLYYLEEGFVKIDEGFAHHYTTEAELHPADFQMEDLVLSQNTMTDSQILEAYRERFNARPFNLKKDLKSLNIGVWNIWHGGKHWNVEDDGWDSRDRIAEIIRQNDIDVILMQETYSNGDYIAASLGYYFATTSDWDYCYQGSNISVISRYPIEEVFVPFEASFNNVGAKIRISKNREIYAMANWYGMNSFPLVFDFHEARFDQTAKIPVFFGGDFNAVPHTDGGNSPASVKMLENGFTDSFRSLYPDVKADPGHTHRSGKRIDQLYYKGSMIENISTEVISVWPGGFPSDHNLILAQFKLN